MKFKRNSLSESIMYGLGAGILASLAMTASPVLAQDADEDATEETADRVQVTGTRLTTNPNIQAPNPVLSVGEEEIESRGIKRIEDLTN